MHLLRRVVVRAVAIGLACLACSLTVTGCAQFNKALGQRQAMVSFKSGVTVEQRLQVRSACAKLPNITAAPIATSVPATSATSVIVFKIAPAASLGDIARLQACLGKFPSLVGGINLTDVSDNG